jgi:hypothetical protein
LGLLWVVVCLLRVVRVEVARGLGVPLCLLLPLLLLLPQHVQLLLRMQCLLIVVMLLRVVLGELLTM